MDTETDWVYRVFEPHGSEGWRPYGRDPERWRGMITTDDLSEGPRYAVSLVVADLMTEWQALGLPRARHVRVFLWRDEEGDEADADIIVEVRPSIHGELPAGDRIGTQTGYARVHAEVMQHVVDAPALPFPQSPRGIRSEHAYLAGLDSIGLSIASWITSLQAEPGQGIDRADRWGIFVVHPATSGCRASASRR